MFVGKFEDIIPLDENGIQASLTFVKEVLQTGQYHSFTNFEIVLLKTLGTQQQEKHIRIKYQDILYKICRLFDSIDERGRRDICTIEEVVKKVQAATRREVVKRMEKRTCPNCGEDWYSADAESDWVCEHCSTTIPKKR